LTHDHTTLTHPTRMLGLFARYMYAQYLNTWCAQSLNTRRTWRRVPRTGLCTRDVYAQYLNTRIRTIP